MKRSAFPLVFGGVGPGSDALDLEFFAGFGEVLGSIAGTVVGHDALDGDAEAFVVGDGGLEEGGGALLSLVWQDLGEGDAGVVVDAAQDATDGGCRPVRPRQAEAIIAEGRADLVMLARGMMYDPRWAWHAARELEVEIAYPDQYVRCHPARWPQAFES